jgi:hypothetical protein
MAQIAQQIDLTSLVAQFQALIQTIGLNARALNIGFNSVKWYHINGAGTFVAKESAGTLLHLNINTGSAGATATIYDSATTVSLPGSLEVSALNIGTVAPSSLPLGPDNRGWTMNNGVVIVTTGSADITFSLI